MIEITDEIITRFETLLHDNVGYAASRNADRILADLVKQAEITEKPSSEIPVAVKFRVVATAEGQLNLVLDDVSWKVLSRSKDDNFYTVGIDPKQPNLPGFDQPEPQPKPVVDVKALPEHESHIKRLLQGYMKLADNCRRNLEKASNELGLPIIIPGDNDHQVKRYSNYAWEVVSVPNVEESLDAMDNGMRIVFDSEGRMTDASMKALFEKGYSVFNVEHVEMPTREWQLWQTNKNGFMEFVKGYYDNDDKDEGKDEGRRGIATELANHTDKDDALLAGCLEMNNL